MNSSENGTALRCRSGPRRADARESTSHVKKFKGGALSCHKWKVVYIDVKQDLKKQNKKPKKKC